MHTWRNFITVALVLALGGAFRAEASLVPVGDALVNDTDSHLTWVQDANLFRTLARSYAGGQDAFVAAVIGAAGGRVQDTPNNQDTPPLSGYRDVTPADFSVNATTGLVNGRMSWWGAQAWVSYLNASDYAGFNDWRLPTALTSVTGYESVSDLGQLFYSELGGQGAQSLRTTHNSNYDLFASVGANTYEVFWANDEYRQNPARAWMFNFGTGQQDVQSKTSKSFALIVRDGLAAPAPVPLPAAIWLFVGALAGLGGVAGRSVRSSG